MTVSFEGCFRPAQSPGSDACQLSIERGLPATTQWANPRQIAEIQASGDKISIVSQFGTPIAIYPFRQKKTPAGSDGLNEADPGGSNSPASRQSDQPTGSEGLQSGRGHSRSDSRVESFRASACVPGRLLFLQPAPADRVESPPLGTSPADPQLGESASATLSGRLCRICYLRGLPPQCGFPLHPPPDLPATTAFFAASCHSPATCTSCKSVLSVSCRRRARLRVSASRIDSNPVCS